MKHTLRKPCKECPYMGKTAGWIGNYDSAKDFHEMVQADVKMACHLTCKTPDDPNANQCIGQVLYANNICKRYKDKEFAKLQDKFESYEDKDEVLSSFDGQKLIDFHGR